MDHELQAPALRDGHREAMSVSEPSSPEFLYLPQLPDFNPENRFLTQSLPQILPFYVHRFQVTTLS